MNKDIIMSRQDFLGAAFPGIEGKPLISCVIDVLPNNQVVINGRVYSFNIEGDTVRLSFRKSIENTSIFTNAIFDNFISENRTINKED